MLPRPSSFRVRQRARLGRRPARRSLAHLRPGPAQSPGQPPLRFMPRLVLLPRAKRRRSANPRRPAFRQQEWHRRTIPGQAIRLHPALRLRLPVRRPTNQCRRRGRRSTAIRAHPTPRYRATRMAHLPLNRALHHRPIPTARLLSTPALRLPRLRRTIRPATTQCHPPAERLARRRRAASLPP